MRYFIGNWKMFGVPKSINILNKINYFHSKDKNYKLLKLVTKAELCLSRDNAKKIIKKAEKLNITSLPR